MLPDLPYYVALSWLRPHTHSVAGIFRFALPIGWALYLLFRLVLRPALLDLAPRALAARVPTHARQVGVVGVSLSLMLGAATHVLWDAITHGELIVALPPGALRSALIGLYSLPHRALQHGSTLAGVALLGCAFACWWRAEAPRFAHRSVVDERSRARLWLGLVAVSLAGGLAFAGVRQPLAASAPALLVFVNISAVTSLSTALVIGLGYTAWWHWMAREEA